jgi:hypothetical protein
MKREIYVYPNTNQNIARIMEISIFRDKTQKPDDAQLQKALGIKYYLWMDLRDYVFEKYPKAIEEWNYPGAKYGWSFRIKDKKRAIVYLLPREQSFKIALVYGERAAQQALTSTISDHIKKEINEAHVYAEGRGFRIDITDEKFLPDIKILIDIKIAN